MKYPLLKCCCYVIGLSFVYAKTKVVYETGTLIASDATKENYFSTSLAMDQKNALISAPYRSNGGNNLI